jgi:hypothetical protein
LTEREYRLTVCKVCGLEAPFECEHMRASKAGGENVYVSIGVVPDAQLAAVTTSYEELRSWVTEALNLPGAPHGEARRALLNALQGVTRLPRVSAHRNISRP